MVQREQAEHFASEVSIPYFEASAKSGEGVKQVFEQVTIKLTGGKKLPEEYEKKSKSSPSL